MTKEEFETWVDELAQEVICSEQYDYSIMNDGTLYVVFEIETNKVGIATIDDNISIYNSGIAMAYARLKGIEIPTIKETPTPWRAENRGRYYLVNNVGSVSNQLDDYTCADNEYYELGNYFKTRKQAESACKKIQHLLKLQRLHDMLCPDCNGEDFKRYCIFYDTKSHEYVVGYWYCRQSDSDVYFTKEAAEKACEILNKEKEND